MDSVLQAGVVSAPLQVLIDRFATFAVQETSLVLGADEEFRKLRRTLERIRAMVGRVEENRSFFSNRISGEAWKTWLEDVEALSFSADDLLDGIELDLAKRAANRDGLQVSDMFTSPSKLTVPRQVNKIRLELEEIAREMDALYKTEFTKLGCKCNPAYNGGTSSLVDERNVIGREGDKNVIVQLLLDERLSTSRVSVVPIIGMGGIGKTTLAQLAYNDNRLVDKFELKMWTSVSMDFDTIRITKSIVESALGKRCKLSGLDRVQVKLQELIRGKRFLLVLDDYWSEEHRDWDILSSPFRVGAHGSKILLTTRSMIVSRIVGTVPSHCVESLSEENSWELLKQRATSGRNLTCEFEQIGRQIAMKCKGLPLAANTLGGMLHFKDDPKEWISVLNSELWDLHSGDNDIFAALALSYYHLPAHLKKCFAYCAMFPKDHDFEVSELVFLWIAEGFVHPTGAMGIEELGYDYFKNLLWRSFFQSSGVNVRGGEMYKMHDLTHSMAQLISPRTCLHLKDSQSNESPTSFKNTRHASMDCPSRQPRVLDGYHWYENLRTLKVMSVHGGNIRVPYHLFLKLKSLRVLDLSRIGLVELPESVEHLKYLRYLNLSENGFMKLPESLANLFSLQILKLEQCPRLRDLPRNTKKMVSLQHLHLDMKQLNEMPPEFGRLVNLQSLSAFIVGRTEGHGIEELKNMKLLRGCLSIKNLDYVPTMNEARQAMLDTKPFLDRLELEWSGYADRYHHEQILHGLRPHENLKELTVTKYNGISLPSWFSTPLCKLSSIILQSCKNWHILAPLAKLPDLKSLTIEGMLNWSQVNQDFSGFQSLESLTMKNIPILVSWDLFRGSRFPRLHTLHIDDCPMLTNLPSLVDIRCFHSLEINQCPNIRSLPHDGFPASLAAVTISDSDMLTNRCRVQEGADWHLIKSVPKIVIDYVEIDWDMRKF
ncbi:putative disease resistance protein RGA3 [Salvia miltiorrhiza]|uniref:putative disease resistance protein RGA3 n=1 Tax=Salvia miltiorrhiza TaxID=226208 RepID=UPI0025ABDDF1|nr:putative disease resistance protein RGA3 [Salvia miltiorrhiza]